MSQGQFDTYLPYLLGPYGVVVLLSLVVYSLWRDNRSLTAKLEAEHQARLADAKANVQTMCDWNEELKGVVNHLTDLASRMTKSPPR